MPAYGARAMAWGGSVGENLSGTFPIVGVGASAGGLAPTTLLLRRLGERPGVGVVVVHHLDPKHESNLVDILSRATSMPVEAARDGERVHVNRVHVLPPGAELTLEHGALRLAPRSGSGAQLPVDAFLSALANDCHGRAVGVVLSGMGADGSRGIASIKAEGGITFAQEGAEHESMPQSAIATGCVDFILPVEEIALEIARMGSRPSGSKDDDDVEDEISFRRILTSIRQATGVDFAHYKATTLRRRIERRGVLRRTTSLRDYADLVTAEPAEVDALAEEVLIHVTSFFRDPGVWEALGREILPRLIAGRRADVPLRVWIPGCSSGEEVYSLAIRLIEVLGDAGSAVPIKIFGTDVSRRAIDRARAALYSESIVEDVTPGRLMRFFRRTERGYQIAKDVRDRCVFATHDITRDPPFSKMDLISCRNLMIYLSATIQQRILPMLHYALAEPGYLVLGTAETVGVFPGFTSADARHKVYARAPAPIRPSFDFGDGRGWSPSAIASPRAERAANAGDVRKEADRTILAAVAPVGVVVRDDLAIVEFRGEMAPFLEPAPGTATLDLLRMAREELRVPLRRAIDEARATGKRARATVVTSDAGRTNDSVEIDVIPFAVPLSDARFFSVLFNERAMRVEVDRVPSKGPAYAATEEGLRHELASTREYLQSVIEQLEAGNEELRASNEEIVSSNEELQSLNEELQTAKEELQTTNEELRTVNDEMLDRNLEATRLADDLSNIVTSVAIPIVILGRDSRIRRFTPAATSLLRIAAADVGRPIADVRAKLGIPELDSLVRDVLDHLAPVERTIQTEDGRWSQLSVRPYRTSSNGIDGTIISVYDIDALTKAKLQLTEARDYAESIVETMHECLVVLGDDLQVRSANRAFYEHFKVTQGDIDGRRLDEAAGGYWNVPALAELLGRLVAGGPPGEVTFELALPEKRVVLANGRRAPQLNVILLALVDITERTRTEARLAEREAGFRQMLTSAAVPVLMSDRNGVIVFANEMAARVFGYVGTEMDGLRVDELLPSRLRGAHAIDRAQFVAAPRSRVMGSGRALVALRKDGTEFPVEVVLSTMESSDGLLIVTFVTDVSARKEAERKVAIYQGKLQKMAFQAALAEERERRRIAGDLHDRIGQSLALARIKLESVREAATGDVQAAIASAIELIVGSVEDTRTLTFELSPPVLYDLGLKAALSWLSEEIEKRAGIHVEIVDDGKRPPFDDAIAALLFRAVRELLTNVFKHAESQTARVEMRHERDDFVIDVEDRGIGFDTERTVHAPNGFGLFSVREQIHRLGGTVAIESTPRQGTRVRLRVPAIVRRPTPYPERRRDEDSSGG